MSRCVGLCLAAAAVTAAAGLPRATGGENRMLEGRVVSPLSPTESLDHIVVPGDLQVELAACEPEVIDPVAVRFDEKGRMWVVQMRDYPDGQASGNTHRSRISVLEDRNSDGRYETAVVFADDLEFATGLQPWRGGAFVTLAGRLVYMKDTSGDGRADVEETWFSGFAQENTQLRANHPTLALDNHIYVANGLRGGTVVDARRPRATPVSISGMDFRFNPRTGVCEAVTGVGQYGLTFDDFGNRVVCTNRNPAIHVVLEERFLQKNPLVAPPAVVHDIAQAGPNSRLFPLAPSWTTSHLHAGQFTAACGVEIYRGDALGDSYYGNLFVCEPTAHLVHREVVRSFGVTFKSRPVTEGVEFFASRDPWCSPVNLEVGPDGALYVVDMYRAVIEHPEFMPSELRQRPDLLLGNDRGRIYRISARKRPSAREAADVSRLSDSSLVDQLAHRNAWHRETAARLLLERGAGSRAQELEDVARASSSLHARIHAVWLLESCQLLSSNLVMGLLADRHPRLVEQAIVASESLIGIDPRLRAEVAKLTDHDDSRVRFVATLVTGALPERLPISRDRWESLAVLIAAGDRGGTVLARLVADDVDRDEESRWLIQQLASIAAAASSREEGEMAIATLVAPDPPQWNALASFFRSGGRRQRPIAWWLPGLPPAVRDKLQARLEDAREAASDPSADQDYRLEAIRFLAADENAVDVLIRLARSDDDVSIRRAAVEALSDVSHSGPWRALLSDFSSAPPSVQQAIVSAVLADRDRSMTLLEEIAAGRIPPALLGAVNVRRLIEHSDAGIKERAQRLLAEAMPADRRQALADFQAAIALTGDAVRGGEIFARHCASCHRIGRLGVDVGPDISDSREKTSSQLLTDIIQPNRAIDSNYFSYTVVTVDGLSHTGIVVTETGSSITLSQAEGKTLTLPRDDVEELRPDGVSLMPEGLERDISVAQMADLIAYIKNWRYLDAEAPPAGGR